MVSLLWRVIGCTWSRRTVPLGGSSRGRDFRRARGAAVGPAGRDTRRAGSLGVGVGGDVHHQAPAPERARSGRAAPLQLGQRSGRAEGLRCDGVGRRAKRVERAEVGLTSIFDRSFESLFVRRECPYTHVHAALHGNLGHPNIAHSRVVVDNHAVPLDSHDSPARSLHSLHGGCGAVNSMDLVGDGVALGRSVWRHGETKPRSTRARKTVRRSLDGTSPVGDEQVTDHRGASEELQVEAREGRASTTRSGTRLVELGQGCEVEVNIPSAPQ